MNTVSTSPKKKVLFVITKSNWGGAQRYVYDLASNLDTNRFEPVVALGGNGTLVDMLTHAGIRTIPLTNLKNSISPKDGWAASNELWHIIRAEKPTILHVNSSVAGFLGTVVGRFARVPRVIFTAHGWAFNEDRPLWQRLLIKYLHWITVISSHRTIAVSRAIQQQMNWLGVKHKMKLIHPGRSIGVMYTHTEARAELIAHEPKLKDAESRSYIWIGTIAELHPIKRINVLIESMVEITKNFPKVRCVIIGDGSERTQLTAHIKAAHLEDKVFLTGNIPEAARLLHAFNYFVLSSRSEAYGYVLHEAGLARLPVVATNVGGIPDIITHQKSGLLIPPDDSHALTKALTTLLRDHTYTETLRHNLHTAMQARTVTRMVTATEAIYTL